MDDQRIRAEVDLGAVSYNLERIRSRLPKGTRLAPVLKADAYGHGAAAVAEALADKADYFAVADVGEAVALRESGVTLPILVFGGVWGDGAEAALRYDLSPAVYRSEDAKELSALAASMGKTAKIHLAVDTGMNRIGFSADLEGARAAAEAATLPHLSPEGVFSHFAEADRPDSPFSALQRASFEGFLTALSSFGVVPPLCHMENSAAAILGEGHTDMVRLGIALYGIFPSESMEKAYGEALSLRPALSLSARIAQVKTVGKGCGIGYGRTFVTARDTVVATVSAGYGDGVPFALSNRGEVLVGGCRCPILGRVCMDFMMVDATNARVKAGDRAVLLGDDGGERITAMDMARAANTIPYEILCGISRRVPRVYVGAR